MTSKERVFAKLSGKPVDRTPNFNILMNFAARYSGRTMDEFCKNYRVLTECNIKCAEDFNIDILGTMSDAYRETADFGANIIFPYDSLPVCEPFILKPSDLRKIKPFRIEDSVRMLDRLYAIEFYKQKTYGEYPIMGWVEGCAAECSDLMGLTNYIYAIYDEPETIRELMDICLETAINCIKPQITAGADIVGIGDAVASVIGPNIYRELILPYEQKMFAEIKRNGAVGRLHICGNITPLLDDLKTCGADIIDIDWMVDFKTAYEKLAQYAIISGNFDPVTIIQDGSPDIISEAVNNCLDATEENCIIMAGCEIPRDTPHRNLKAVHEALAARSENQ